MKRQVLIVEDDETLRASLAQTLELADITPIPTVGFLQARRSIRRNFAGVILSDIRMPDYSGFDVLSFAQSVDQDLPVILLTAHSDVPTAMKA
ncbi:MAG: response regulator, partial [Pseudomonadota bacterium]